MNVDGHKNVEKVIRYYLLFMPPKGCRSIIDIGSGITSPYKGLLKNLTGKYVSLDIREGADITADLTEKSNIPDKFFEWGWCSEVIEHVEKEKQYAFVNEVMRICENAVFTYPTPLHPSFLLDEGHHEVVVDFGGLGYNVIDKSTTTGRNIYILTDKSRIYYWSKGKIYENTITIWDDSRKRIYVENWR